MKPHRKTAALIVLTFSYLLAVGWLSVQVSLCGCGGWALLQDLHSGLRQAAEATSAWNSWLGNSWALGSASWAKPAPKPSSPPAFEVAGVAASSPEFPEWRERPGIPVIEREDSEDSPEARDASDCLLSKLRAVEVVFRRAADGRIRPHLALDLHPRVVVVTAKMEKVEAPASPAPMIQPSAGCQSYQPKPRRRSVT